ncbi:hypothetical protein UPYG_G00005210 [Umbra pygmaea]|uniref:Uncharacterized protein n=1 Tax=Umbra pygmaea TaxID=75934 RepID=A0ABD0Y1I7_UMBPY
MKEPGREPNQPTSSSKQTVNLERQEKLVFTLTKFHGRGESESRTFHRIVPERRHLPVQNKQLIHCPDCLYLARLPGVGWTVRAPHDENLLSLTCPDRQHLYLSLCDSPANTIQKALNPYLSIP